jgi:hypothetical protein
MFGKLSKNKIFSMENTKGLRTMTLDTVKPSAKSSRLRAIQG